MSHKQPPNPFRMFGKHYKPPRESWNCRTGH